MLSCTYYLFSEDYLATLSGSLVDIMLIFVPMMSFFVFYHFNKKFRKEFYKIVCLVKSKSKNDSNKSNMELNGSSVVITVCKNII